MENYREWAPHRGLSFSEFSAAGNVAFRCTSKDDDHSIRRVTHGLGHYLRQGVREFSLLDYCDLRVEQVYSDCRQISLTTLED